MKVKEICDYSGSTLLGMNGGMVESPDSKRIIYARKADLISLKRKYGYTTGF